MIVLSIACLRYAILLRRVRPENVLWTYLLALSLALTAFAVSRAVGHLANRLLSLAGKGHLWNAVLPYSGAVNTLTFVVVGSITLFFQRVQINDRAVGNGQDSHDPAGRTRSVFELDHKRKLLPVGRPDHAAKRRKFVIVFQ